MKNKLLKGAQILVCVGLGMGLIFVGMKAGEDVMTKKLINMYEEGSSDYLLVADKATGLLYEIKAECIGD